MKGTWQTTGSGGSGLALVAAVIVAAAVAVPVLDALAHLIEVLAIVLGIALGVALAGGAALVVYRLRHKRTIPAADVPPSRPVPWRATEPLQVPQRQAIEGRREVHLHFHGASAEDIAEALHQLPGN